MVAIAATVVFLALVVDRSGYDAVVGGVSLLVILVLLGILRVTVLVAISRPAEFIEITFQQQMQKS